MIIPSKWVILKWCSLWNDIWLSLRKKRQRPQSFWNALWLSLRNDISKANFPLHACGVFQVLVDWILPKFNRQELGWKIVCQSFSRWSMTILLKWATAITIVLKWYIYCPFEMTNDYPFKMSGAVLYLFRYDIWLSFRYDGAKFSSRELFSSARTPKILVTKMTPKPYIFVHRFFRSICPCCVKI